MRISWPTEWLMEDWPEVYNTGVTEPWTQQVVASLLRASCKSSVLELGSYLGHTTTWLADVLAQSVHVRPVLRAVEMDHERATATEDKLKRLNTDLDWMVHREDTIEYLKRTKPHQFDFVWVDDDHHADHVAEELELLIKPTHREDGVVAEGGLILMHDVFGPHGLAGVCARYGGVCIDFPRLHSDGGLGIIQL